MGTPAPLHTTLRAWRRTRPESAAYTHLRPDGHGGFTLETLTWEQLDLRVGALARRLTTMCDRQDRVVLALPQTLHYPVAFFACLRAALVAVPVSTVESPGHAMRLRSVIADCDPMVVLTTEEHLDAVREVVERAGSDPDRARAPRIVAVDDGREPGLRPAPAEAIGAEDVAYLQYTSGSTSAPAGVVVTHGALHRNLDQIVERFTPDAGCTAVSWLPFFHDMGLLNGLLVPVRVGCRAVFMDPTAFIRQPTAWIGALARFPRAYSAAPNFAFELSMRRMQPADMEGIDLSGLHGVVVGSEPINGTVMRWVETELGRVGLRPDALMPSYGLAENVVLVSGDRGVRTYTLDADALRRDRAERAPEGSGGVTLVGCGRPVDGLSLRIVDPHGRVSCPPGRIGEVWCHDPDAPHRYWSSAGRQEDTFDGQLEDGGESPRSGWLRTGDLGVLIDGELVITGRIKDLIIIDGVNHYPSDIERTATDVHPAVRAGRLVAFSVPAPEGGDSVGGEQVVLVIETREGREVPKDLASQIRHEVTRVHSIPVRDVRLVSAGTLPLSTSGKVRRQAARALYLAGRFDEDSAR